MKSLPTQASPSIRRVSVRGEEIRRFILSNIERPGIANAVVDRFRITRQAANKHLQRLVAEGALIPEGKTSHRSYKLAAPGDHIENSEQEWDAELRAISNIVNAFETLDMRQRQRVLKYLGERYGQPATAGVGEKGDTNGRDGSS